MYFFDTRKLTSNKIPNTFNSINRKFVCVCEKQLFANFTQEKKTNVMYFHHISFLMYFFLVKCALSTIFATHICEGMFSKLLKQCVCVFFHLITREERNSESSFLDVGGDWGYWIFTQWGFSKHTVLCCAGEAASYSFNFNCFSHSHFSEFLLFTFNGAHILFDFFLFLLHARQKRIHFCKVFPWVWIYVFFFFVIS